MQFNKTVRIDAPIGEVWSLVNDIESVAACIPGVSEVRAVGPDDFDSLVSMRVGPVTANFSIRTTVQDRVPERSVTALTQGLDKRLGSNVKVQQVFELRPDGDQTEVDISADVQVTGRIATFGQRIISAKAEQVILEALENVSRLLRERRSTEGRNAG